MLERLANVRIKPVGYLYVMIIMMAVCRVLGI